MYWRVLHYITTTSEEYPIQKIVSTKKRMSWKHAE